MKRGKFFKIKKPTLTDFYRSFTDRSANYWLGVVALFVVISRWLGRMQFLYSSDSVNYALALKDYDITLHQPHPPGYALYILLAKSIYWLVGDANLALVIVSILFSVALVYAVFYLAKAIYGQPVAWISVFLLISSPMVWFHGQVALNYLSDALFASLFALLIYRTITEPQTTKWTTWSSIILAVGGGFRPTLMVFLAPLWLWMLWRQKNWRTFLWQAGLVAIITLLWLVPSVYLSGGLTNSWNAVYSLIFDKSALYSFSIGAHGWQAITEYGVRVFHNLTLSLGWATGFILLFLVYLAAPRTDSVKLNYPLGTFWLLWLLPAVAFYLLVVFTIPGYLLIILPAVVVLTAKAIEEVLRGIVKAVGRSSRRRTELLLSATIAVTAILTGANIYHYYRPDPIAVAEKPTHFSIRSLNHLWDNLIPTIKDNFNPQNTVIGIDRPFMAWGLPHFKYYLSDYVVYQKIFWGTYNPNQMSWYRVQLGQMELVEDIRLTSLDSKFIVIRDKWSGTVSKFYSQIPLIRGHNNIGELLYYDLTDPAVREAVVDLGTIILSEEASEETDTTDIN